MNEIVKNFTPTQAKLESEVRKINFNSYALKCRPGRMRLEMIIKKTWRSWRIMRSEVEKKYFQSIFSCFFHFVFVELMKLWNYFQLRPESLFYSRQTFTMSWEFWAYQSSCGNFASSSDKILFEKLFLTHTVERDIFHIASLHQHTLISEIFSRQEFFAHFWDLRNAEAGGCWMAWKPGASDRLERKLNW